MVFTVLLITLQLLMCLWQKETGGLAHRRRNTIELDFCLVSWSVFVAGPLLSFILDLVRYRSDLHYYTKPT